MSVYATEIPHILTNLVLREPESRIWKECLVGKFTWHVFKQLWNFCFIARHLPGCALPAD